MQISKILWEIEQILADREEDYGSPEDNFQRIANLWSIHLEQTLTVDDVAAMMVLLKIARLGTSPNHRDSMLDIAGYAVIASSFSGKDRRGS